MIKNILNFIFVLILLIPSTSLARNGHSSFSPLFVLGSPSGITMKPKGSWDLEIPNLTLTALTEGSIPYIEASGVVSENNTDLFWDNTNETLTVGESGVERTITINGLEFKSRIRISDFGITNLASFQLHRHSSTATIGAIIVGSRARGNTASHTIVQDGDNLLDVGAAGWNGNDYSLSSAINFEVDGTPGDNDMPGRIVFLTSPDGSETLTESLRIKNDQNILIASDNELQFGDTGTIIQQSADGELDLKTDGNITFGDGGITNYTNIDSEGTITQAGTARIDWGKITANNITQGNGTHSGTTGGGGGLVGDIQTAFDGNFYHIDEVGSDPGFELTVEFTSVTAFNWVNILATYDGAATHPVQIALYNFNTTTWDGYDAFSVSQAEVVTSGEYTLENHDFFVPSDTNYIGTGGDSGDVRIRIRHTALGNAAHDLDLDVVALYQ
jgi:hypothetical protein